MRCEDISKGSVSRSDKDLGAVVESARARPLDLRRRLAARRRHAVQAELLMRNFFTLTAGGGYMTTVTLLPRLGTRSAQERR